jgi:hypothetical protein
MSKRFDEENYVYTKLTKTKSCEGCACTALMFCAGLQDGAKHYLGNATSFSEVNVSSLTYSPLINQGDSSIYKTRLQK